MKISNEKTIEILYKTMLSCEGKIDGIDAYWEGVVDGQHDLCLELLEQLGCKELIKGHNYVNAPEE